MAAVFRLAALLGVLALASLVAASVPGACSVSQPSPRVRFLTRATAYGSHGTPTLDVFWDKVGDDPRALKLRELLVDFVNVAKTIDVSQVDMPDDAFRTYAFCTLCGFIIRN